MDPEAGFVNPDLGQIGVGRSALSAGSDRFDLAGELVTAHRREPRTKDPKPVKTIRTRRVATIEVKACPSGSEAANDPFGGYADGHKLGGHREPGAEETNEEVSHQAGQARSDP